MPDRDETLRALVAKWRKEAVGVQGSDEQVAWNQCADELNAALAAPTEAAGVVTPQEIYRLWRDTPVGGDFSEVIAAAMNARITAARPTTTRDGTAADDRIGDVNQRRLHDEGNARIGQRMAEYFRLDKEREDDRIGVSQETMDALRSARVLMSHNINEHMRSAAEAAGRQMDAHIARLVVREGA